MVQHDDHVWGIILAAGDGKRLKQFVRSRYNTDRPKQFCVFTGNRTMLAHTIARARHLISPDHLLVTVNKSHLDFAGSEFEGLPESNIIVQPSNRETTASILYPLLHIIRRDPNARVVVFPSDHFIVEEQRFMQHVASGDAFVARHPKYVLLLGVYKEERVADYGWIEASMRIAEIDNSEIFRVNRFLEKPDTEKVNTLQKNRTLCNTMVIVGHASSMLRRFRLTIPAVYQAFKRIDAALLSPDEEETVRAEYEALPSIDFSKVILGHDPRSLAVLYAKDVYWSDWGNGTRIQSDVAGIRNESEI